MIDKSWLGLILRSFDRNYAAMAIYGQPCHLYPY